MKSSQMFYYYNRFLRLVFEQKLICNVMNALDSLSRILYILSASMPQWFGAVCAAAFPIEIIELKISKSNSGF